MPNEQIDLIKKEFGKYLESLGVSPKSHKNYRSDLSYFLSWTILKVRSFGAYVESLTEVVPFLNSGIANEYKNYMVVNNIPVKTINRRLSTLRHLSRFLHSSDNIDADFMENIENVSEAKTQSPTATPIVDDFRSYLEAQKVSKNTIKNYVSDIQQFLRWAETANNQELKINN